MMVGRCEGGRYVARAIGFAARNHLFRFPLSLQYRVAPPELPGATPATRQEGFRSHTGAERREEYRAVPGLAPPADL